MDDHNWWWHLLYDPMIDNGWSLTALAILLAAGIWAMWLSARR